MVSFRDQIAVDNAAVFLDTSNGFADALTHYPGGDVLDGETVAGTFIEDDSDRRNGSGDSTLRKGNLWIDSTVTVTQKDAWLIDGDTWHVVTCHQLAMGLRKLELRLVEKKSTRTAQNGLR